MADTEGVAAPSLGMVAAGGVGVLVVLAFVAAVALGGRTGPAEPGARVAVGRADASGALAVFVPRCPDERVTAVEVAGEGGQDLWRIASRKGSIDERYVVGAAPPLGFEVEVPLQAPLPSSRLVASVTVDDEVSDATAFTFASVPEGDVLHQDDAVDIASFQAMALSAASCPGSGTDRRVTTVLFGSGAIVVVGAYGLMVSRWWRAR